MEKSSLVRDAVWSCQVSRSPRGKAPFEARHDSYGRRPRPEATKMVQLMPCKFTCTCKCNMRSEGCLNWQWFGIICHVLCTLDRRLIIYKPFACCNRLRLKLIWLQPWKRQRSDSSSTLSFLRTCLLACGSTLKSHPKAQGFKRFKRLKRFV